MRKPIIIMIALLLLVFGGIFGAKYYHVNKMITAMKTRVVPPMLVSATKAKAEQWDPSLFAVGSLKAAQGIAVTTEVAGIVNSVHFQSGQWVKKGQRLIQLDDQSEKAELQSWIAQSKLDRLNFNRDENLLSKKVLSQNTLDTSSTTLQKSVASVDQARDAVNKKAIRAPFSGKIGVSQVDLGQYISPGYAMVSLQDIDSLKVDFYLPEQDFPKLYKGQKIRVQVDAYPNRVFSGSITATDAEVDATTRKILVRAHLNNKKRLLLPGMFANIRVMSGHMVSVVSVPLTAIDYSLYGKIAYVLQATKQVTKEKKTIYKLHKVYVKTGLEQHGHIAVIEGLKANQLVIDAGQLKLTDGMRVVVAASDTTKTE